MDLPTFRKIAKRLDADETVLVRLKIGGGYWLRNTSKYVGSVFEVTKVNLEKKTLQVTADGLARKLNYGYRNLLLLEGDLGQAELNLTNLVVAEETKEDLPTPRDHRGKIIKALDQIAFSHTDGHVAIGEVLEIDSENRVVWKVILGTASCITAYRRLPNGKVLKTRNPHEKMVVI